MTFIIISLISGAILFLSLTFHRFCGTHPEARDSIIYSVVARKYWKWIAERASESVKNASPARWQDFAKRLSLWKYPDLEKWLFISFYGSFLYLAASGFFFAFLVPRGIYGYPLLFHVGAGAIFAMSLALIVLLRGKNYVLEPKIPELTYAILDPKALGLTSVRIRNTIFWLFVLSGFLLTVSALAPMVPLLRYGGQKLMSGLHRYSALIAVLSAVAFVDLDSSSSKRPKP